MNPVPSQTNVDRTLIRTAWISVWISVLVLGIKFYGYAITHSESVLSDALESVVNVVTALVALFVMRAAAEPADEEHPYGHGKLEFFSAAFEGGFIVFAALAIVYSAIVAFMNGPHFENLMAGVGFLSLATLLNVVTSWYLFSISKKHKSAALRASATHLMVDVVTTVALVLGIMVTHFFDLAWLDNVLALLVAAHILREGILIVRRSAGALIDETDVASVKDLAKALEKNRVEGLIDIHKLKIIRSGRFHHIDAHMVVPEFWSVEEAHQRTHRFEKAVLLDYEFDGEMAFHLDPCHREFCRSCDVKDCAVRAHPLKKTRTFVAADLGGVMKTDDQIWGPVHG